MVGRSVDSLYPEARGRLERSRARRSGTGADVAAISGCLDSPRRGRDSRHLRTGRLGAHRIWRESSSARSGAKAGEITDWRSGRARSLGPERVLAAWNRLRTGGSPRPGGGARVSIRRTSPCQILKRSVEPGSYRPRIAEIGTRRAMAEPAGQGGGSTPRTGRTLRRQPAEGGRWPSGWRATRRSSSSTSRRAASTSAPRPRSTAHRRPRRPGAWRSCMISSELPEVLGMADRVIVMHEGRVDRRARPRRGEPGERDVRGDRTSAGDGSGRGHPWLLARRR